MSTPKRKRCKYPHFVAVRVDDTVALVVVNIAQCKESKEAGLTRTSLTNDINVTATVAAIHAELVFNATEISKTKGRDVLVIALIAS